MITLEARREDASGKNAPIPLFSGSAFDFAVARLGSRSRPPLPWRLRLGIVWLLTWVPLLIVAAAEGHAWGDKVTVPFLYDFRVHIRFLAVVPLFLMADIVIEPRLNQVVDQFVASGLVREENRDCFDAIVERTRCLARSYLAELVILVIVIALLAFGVRKEQPLNVSTWLATPADDRATLTAAGWWMTYFGIPLYQFILLEVLWRFGLWVQLLWRVSRLPLRLNASHPDRSGGLAFVGIGQSLFAYFVVGFAALFAGVIGNEVVYNAADLSDYAIEIAGLAVGSLIVFLAPLFVFTPRLLAAKMDGFLGHETLYSEYVRAFDAKWITDRPADMTPFLGSEEFQGLGALSGGFDNVKRMRIVPIDLFVALWFVAATVLPMLPLLLTVYRPEEILRILRGFLL